MPRVLNANLSHCLPTSRGVSDSDGPKPRLSSLKLFYCNTRSLLPKVDLLFIYAATYNPFVIALTETWLNESLPSSLCCPPHYIPFRQDRQSGRGGGSLILVNDLFPTSLLSVLPSAIPTSSNSRIDAVACRVSFSQGLDLGILCVYRPPDSSTEDIDYMLSIINKFLSFNLKFNVIFSDFNFPDIVWPYRAANYRSNLFLSFCLDHHLIQHVKTPTRRASNSILDLVLTTPGTDLTKFDISEELGSSDHAIIQCELGINCASNRKTVVRRDIRKVDWNCFRDFLSQSNDWSEILSLKDINLAWDYLVKSINSFLDLHAPLRSIPLRNFRTTSKIRTLLRATRRFYKIMIHSPTTSNIAMYERQKLLLKKASDQESYAKEDKISKSSDSRLFWSCLLYTSPSPRDLSTSRMPSSA